MKLPLDLSHEKLQFLIEAIEIISSSLEPEEVLENIMNQAGKLTDSEAASIFIVDESKKTLQLKVATNLTHEQVKEISTPIGKGIVGYVAATGKLVNLSNVQEDERFFNKVDKKTGLITKSCLTVPLVVENKIVGATQVINKRNAECFTTEDEFVLTEFSRLASITLNKAWMHAELLDKKRMEADLDIACSIQQKLLPFKELKLANYTFRGFYKPARNVGGDYFDYYQLSEDEVFFTVGDVTGKGAQASILMATVKSFLSASLDIKNDLIDIVYRLNNFFYHNSPPDIFITMFLGIINVKTGHLLYINAGHEPPLIFKDSVFVEELTSNCIMLGAFNDMVFETSETYIKQGDVLFIYTDGVTEAKGNDEKMFGVPRLKEVLKKCHNEMPEYLKNVPEEILNFVQENEQSDDITFLVVKGN